MTPRPEPKRARPPAALFVAVGFLLGGLLEAREQRPALAPFVTLQFGVNASLALRRMEFESAALVIGAAALAALLLTRMLRLARARRSSHP